MNQPITTLCNVNLQTSRPSCLMGGESKKKVEQRTHREILLNLFSCSHVELHVADAPNLCNIPFRLHFEDITRDTQ